MLFERPTDVSDETFSPVIQAMTSGEFFEGVSNCILRNTNGTSAVKCINALMFKALQDCVKYEPDTHCWMVKK